MAKTVKAIREEVKQLSYASIDADCRTMDWQEALGENMEGWKSYEAITCDKCGKALVVSELGECRHNDLDHESTCSGYINHEGPMMNYFYPADFRMSCEEAAKLCEGCCIVIKLEDGTTGFALAGGGMDLSWDIAGSYVACGLLPPAWIRLPEFAGMTLDTHRRRIIEACRESAEGMAARARSNTADLDRLVKRLRENGRKRRQAKKG